MFPSTILKGLGLEGKLTADQIAKKWDNLRTKYKVISRYKMLISTMNVL